MAMVVHVGHPTIRPISNRIHEYKSKIYFSFDSNHIVNVFIKNHIRDGITKQKKWRDIYPYGAVVFVLSVCILSVQLVLFLFKVFLQSRDERADKDGTNKITANEWTKNKEEINK